MVAIKATKPTVVTCTDCGSEVHPAESATCASCFDNAVQEAVIEQTEEPPAHGQVIRDWAARRHLLGQISAEVRAGLEQCADDIEVGHG